MAELLSIINNINKPKDELYDKKVAVNIKNEQEQEEFFDILDDAGINIPDDTRKNSFKAYGNRVCYSIEHNELGHRLVYGTEHGNYYSSHYNIIRLKEFKDLII